MNWYLQVLKNYAKFEGRARREEYWMFNLLNGLIIIALGILASVSFFFSSSVSLVISGLFPLYLLLLLIPHIAVSVRRLHDIGKSGWMILIILIPFVGGIWFFILSIIEGDKGSNEYGADPKEKLLVE